MKRLQILIDEELDADLRRLAAQTGRSKGAIVRDAVRAQVRPLPPIEEDAIWGMVGTDSYEPVDPKDIDKVVYEI